MRGHADRNGKSDRVTVKLQTFPFNFPSFLIQSDSINHTPVAGYDFLPTFYDLAGGQKPEIQLTEDVDGQSLRPLLCSSTKSMKGKPRALIFHRPGPSFSAIRKGDYKLMLFWKGNGSVDRKELYKVGTDPLEEGFDISGKEPDMAESLRKELLFFLQKVDAETPVSFRKK